ncbi:MAG: ATPase P [Spirochaetes bacterium]|jgi:soluble P-type ATPase|nr:ATPase P [Spirochaetota bacterium]
MIRVEIPGYRTLAIEHLVLDYNGTIAEDGRLIDGVAELLGTIAGCCTVHVITADTFGKARAALGGLPCGLTVLPVGDQARAKFDYVRSLGSDTVASIGNGRNDRLMLDESALGIAVIQREGAALDAITSADLVCPDIISALELLLNPLRLVATLRS